ncbi:MAG: hypothetical protein VSS75_034010 [Candidatus Parabeggiatoa sp.]|nr:hypothetical protein [Candidatus Parabeggiatoa sp.]
MNNKSVIHPKGFEVKTAAKAGGQCNKWEKADFIKIINNSDPWCYIDGEWNPYPVAEFANENYAGKRYDQMCCTDWRD